MIYNSFPGVRSFSNNYILESSMRKASALWRCKAVTVVSSHSNQNTVTARTFAFTFYNPRVWAAWPVTWCTVRVGGTQRPPERTAPSSSWSLTPSRGFTPTLTRRTASRLQTGRRVSRVGFQEMLSWPWVSLCRVCGWRRTAEGRLARHRGQEEWWPQSPRTPETSSFQINSSTSLWLCAGVFWIKCPDDKWWIFPGTV